MIDTHKKLIELLFEWGWLQAKTDAAEVEEKTVTKIKG
jgi:hypothetical protein